MDKGRVGLQGAMMISSDFELNGVMISILTCQVDTCIIGWHSKIGAWSRLENHCVWGEDVQSKVCVYEGPGRSKQGAHSLSC